jgi:sulfur carrier protein
MEVRVVVQDTVEVGVEMEIEVNGGRRRLAAGCTVADLLAGMEVAGRRVAVERNGSIVPRSAHASTRLAAGDRIEVVIAVGGG